MKEKMAVLIWYDQKKQYGLLNDGSGKVIYLNSYYLKNHKLLNQLKSGIRIKYIPVQKGNVVHATSADII